MVNLRAVGPEDWALWRELRLAALADAPAAFGSTLAEWSGPHDIEDRWRDRLSAVPCNLVAFADGEPAGMVSGVLHEDGTAELISLWVRPQLRGRGVGDTLIDAVAQWSGRQPGEPMLYLLVKLDNAPAIALYARHGFADGGPADAPDERIMRRPT